MKQIFLSIALLFALLSAQAQILCIKCFDQNDSLSSNVTNLILNGGFENNTCTANVYSSSFCPNSQYFSCTLADWTCTGGGTSSYTSIDNSSFTVVADGTQAAYLGNGSFAKACVNNDTLCIVNTNCVLSGFPAGYPTNTPDYGDTTGVSIEQTVNGLSVGNDYALEFWAGGEPQTNGWMKQGVFAVDLGFGKHFLYCKPTGLGHIGTRYLIQFKATSTSHTIKFTNWGHICIPCTEVILDNVRLYRLGQLASQYLCKVDGIEENQAENITISPNPGNGTFLLSGLSVGNTIEIYSPLGQKIITTVANSEETAIDLQAQPAGAYFYVISNANGLLTSGKLWIHN